MNVFLFDILLKTYVVKFKQNTKSNSTHQRSFVGIAEKFKSDFCTFEDTDFNCGYTTSELGTWRWTRQTGKDNNLLTGPESDAHGDSLGWFSEYYQMIPYSL